MSCEAIEKDMYKFLRENEIKLFLFNSTIIVVITVNNNY